MEKRGQIWVETMIYTLIGLTVISAVLGVAIPRINQYTDETILSKTTEAFLTLNKAMTETMTEATGNRREVEILIRKGEIFFEPNNNYIYYILRGTKFRYSQPDQVIKQGDITTLTKTNGRAYDIYLLLNYTSQNINMTVQGKKANQTLSKASAPYKLLLQNEGTLGDFTQVNIEII